VTKQVATAIPVWPGRLALLLALMTFPLIWVGGLVTTTKSGMAVPDWPQTYNHNMFTYPMERWLGDNFALFIEHFHRLLASSVGMVTILLLISTFRKNVPVWARQLATVALLLVISQGILGGMRVLLDQRTFAMFHGCLGPFFFAYVCSLVYLFRPSVLVASDMDALPEGKALANASLSLRRKWLAGSLVMLAGPYVQLCIGAFLRHVPLNVRADVFGMVVLLHVVLALTLLVQSMLFFGGSVMAKRQGIATWVGVSGVVAMLMIAQVAAGAGTYVLKYGFPAWLDSFPTVARFVVEERSTVQTGVVTFHVANGSLIVGLSAIVAAQVWRFWNKLSPAPALSLGGAA